jgi:NAD(P)-dependent dehydrogenase (short-subunit alcohol dehydrogenase family)
MRVCKIDLGEAVMSEAQKPAKAVVIGVGAYAGLGAALCRRFAAEGKHVLVASRTAEQIEEIASGIRAHGGQATAVQTDATDEDDVVSLFDMAMADGDTGPADLVVFNAGNNARGDLDSMSAEFFEDVWRSRCLSGFLVGREASRRLGGRGHGTVIFTGATASLRSRPPFTAFASAKAALRAIAQSMARDLGPKGVHVAHVIIDGGINGERLRSRAPDIAERLGEDGLLDPDAIADAYWHLHTQSRTAWTFELDLRPAKEAF